MKSLCGVVVVLTACLAALGLVACGREDENLPSAAPVPGVKNFRQPADVTLAIAGDHTGSFRGTANLTVLTGAGPGRVQLFVLGLAEPVDIGDATADAFVQLKDFAGNGRYKALPPTGETPLPNDAYVTWIKPASGDTPIKAVRYDKVAGPCDIELRDDGAQGNATCEALAATGGEHLKVKLTFTWKFKGKPVDLLATTTSTPAG
jgi:hypothetical protein